MKVNKLQTMTPMTLKGHLAVQVRPLTKRATMASRLHVKDCASRAIKLTHGFIEDPEAEIKDMATRIDLNTKLIDGDYEKEMLATRERNLKQGRPAPKKRKKLFGLF